MSDKDEDAMGTSQESLNDLYRRWNAEDRTLSALTGAFKILVGPMWAIVLVVACQAGLFGYLLHATGADEVTEPPCAAGDTDPALGLYDEFRAGPGIPRGHDPACWWPLVDARGRPLRCHVDVLLELANR